MIHILQSALDEENVPPKSVAFYLCLNVKSAQIVESGVETKHTASIKHYLVPLAFC